ncbi:hypothetical protein [Dulcicalothrix desertica]|nr:hypothetical protein [Dulcicalothrix desertica]
MTEFKIYFFIQSSFRGLWLLALGLQPDAGYVLYEILGMLGCA